MYQIDEIFYSIQGEGVYVGVPSHFIRFTSCNRECEFCDTSRPKERTMEMSLPQIAHSLHILHLKCNRVVLTGGEPFTQEGLKDLLYYLHRLKYDVAIETNGDLLPNVSPPGNVFVTVSPKVWLEKWPAYIGEIKWLVGDGKELWQRALREKLVCTRQFLQPVTGPTPEATYRNLQTTLHLVKENPSQFRLGVQLHKMVGIR